MTTVSPMIETQSQGLVASIQRDVERAIDELMAWLPDLNRYPVTSGVG